MGCALFVLLLEPSDYYDDEAFVKSNWESNPGGNYPTHGVGDARGFCLLHPKYILRYSFMPTIANHLRMRKNTT